MSVQDEMDRLAAMRLCQRFGECPSGFKCAIEGECRRDVEARVMAADAVAERLRAAARKLGSRGGKKGGPARATKLSKERRSEIARNAAKKRWDRERAK